MSAGPQTPRRRHPKMFLVSSHLKLQDHLDGPVRVERGSICKELPSPSARPDLTWVKVLDTEKVLRIPTVDLLDIPKDLSGLLEAVHDPETRLKLFDNKVKLRQLAALPLGTALLVQRSQSDHLMEAVLRYRGPLTGGGTAILFGVELKGAAAGRGGSSSIQGQPLFACRKDSALFVPANCIQLRGLSRAAPRAPKPSPDHAGGVAAAVAAAAAANNNNYNNKGYRGNGDHPNTHPLQHHQPPQPPPPPPQQQQQQPCAGVRVGFNQRPEVQPLDAVSILPRAAESAPGKGNGNGNGPSQAKARAASPPALQVGQRVCFTLQERLQGGEVRYCGPLPGRASSGTFVGVLLDAPVGNWDGFYKTERLCQIPGPLWGMLLPITKVSPESSAIPPPGLLPFNPKPILKPAPPPYKPCPPFPSGPTPPPKVALMPPKLPLTKSPAFPPSMVIFKVLPPVPVSAPVPPPKPQAPPSPMTSFVDPPWPADGEQVPASPAMLSPGGSEDGGWRDSGTDGVTDGRADGVSELEVGSMVEVNDPPLFGVIRWIGRIGGINQTVAGMELDQELAAATDGSYLGSRYFRCPANKGLFVKLRNCRRDSRFPAPETPVNQVERCNSIAFAEWASERVEKATPPLEGKEVLEVLVGWMRGIQGHLNSCYLDASLFSLFSCCSSADWVMLGPSGAPAEPPGSSRAKDLLRCEIVNPLRRYGYVCASKTMALRVLLEAENNTGFTSQEKDPEEFLNMLFRLLHVEPLLKIRSMSQEPQECHLYQLFPPTDLPHSPSFPLPFLPPLSSPSPTLPHSPSFPLPFLPPLSSHPPDPPPALPPALPPGAGPMRVASVQAMLDSSFLHTGLKFVEAPSCLLLLMPRFGKDFKMYDVILPTQRLDITDLLDDTLRQCSICQAVAEWECSQCYPDQDITPGRLKQYCPTCNTQVHSHRKRQRHKPEAVRIPGGWRAGPLHGTRQRLELFAVTCIETSHYVSLVKHGPCPSDWLFFDSMADREGGLNGFNIPQVRACPEVGRFLRLSEEELSHVNPASLPETARRLLCDAYMCFYHSPELSLYK